MSAEVDIKCELFRGDAPSETESEILLAQYRLFVEIHDALLLRRYRTNTFFLSVNSIVLAAAGFLLRDDARGGLEALALIGLSLGGGALCFVWHRLLRTFRQMSRAKSKIIRTAEERLPARFFYAEWTVLGRDKDPKKYTPFSQTEAMTPIIFAALHGFFYIVGLVQLCSFLVAELVQIVT